MNENDFISKGFSKLEQEEYKYYFAIYGEAYRPHLHNHRLIAEQRKQSHTIIQDPPLPVPSDNTGISEGLI